MSQDPHTSVAEPSHAADGAPADRLTRSHWVAASAMAAALLILAGMTAAGTWHLRHHLREHLVQRDGEILYAVALARQYANGAGEALSKRMGHPADQLALALDISQLREDTLAVRLFDAQGRFVSAFPPSVVEKPLDPALLPALRALQPVSVFHDRANLADDFWISPAGRAGAPASKLLEVNIPLHAKQDTRLLGAAQLLLDGHALTREYARVDEHLWKLAAGAYVVGALLLSAVLAWAYLRLRTAQAQIEERTARLLRANHELALASKTNAVGAVTAHLIHGLSNPLANLQGILNSQRDGSRADVWQDAAAATRHMQQLVHEVVRVLGETRGGDHYELTLAELVEVLNSKLQSQVHDAGVNLVTLVQASGTLSNHHANLVLLILENLVHNALKVTPRAGWVQVRFTALEDQVQCAVEDCGPGISPEVLPRLFTPCRSTQGGSGLGLAISRQLAHHIAASIELTRNSNQGCVFTLALPRRIITPSAVPEPLPPTLTP